MPAKTKTLTTYVLDASGSMSMRIAKVIELVNASISKLDPSEMVNVYTFDAGQIRLIRNQVPAQQCKITSADYRAGGGTNLIFAVDEAAKMAEAFKPTRALTIVLTDGADTDANPAQKRALATKLQKMQDTDKHTFAWMVPPDCIEATEALGIDNSNILPWTKVEEAAQGLADGQKRLAAAVASGKSSLRKGFFVDLASVKKADVRAQMTLVTCKRASVTARGPIKAFCEANFGEFVKGKAHYELTSREMVQSYKEVLLIDKRRPTEVFKGGRGILGLPAGDVSVNPKELGNYRAFIQSTSVNRATDVGTEILYV